MKYNGTIGKVQVTTDLSSEPLTLQEVKRHLNLSFDTAGSFDLTDDDTYLTELITEVRADMEELLGLSLGVKTLTAELRNECGGIEIPFGPVISITSITDEDGNVLVADTDYKTHGLDFPKILWPTYDYLLIIYQAGYETIPPGLKRALKEEIAYRYNSRGDEENRYRSQVVGVSQGARDLAFKYSRKTFIL